MSKATLNRLKKIEAALKPSPARGRLGAGVIPIFRQSDVDPSLFRPENGGVWVSEAEMLKSLPATIRKNHPIVVIVKGTWSELTNEA